MLQPGTTAGRYLRGGVLGTGSSATVYQAHDQLLDRPVALKEIHLADGHSVLLAEARAAAGISHHNVVTIHDVVQNEDGTFIAMELLEGPTLAEVLQHGNPGLPEVLRIACEIAAALDAAHRRGVVHCDIKPDNVFVTSTGRTVVTDFGLAAPELGGGTPGYMAPEQYGDAASSPEMDVFAWACVLVEMLCGEAPFGAHPMEAEHRTLNEAPRVDHSTLSLVPGLSELVLRCLDKEARNRPADGGELLGALAALMSQAPPLTVPTLRDTPADEPLGAPSWVPNGYDPSTPTAWYSVRLVVCPHGEEPWVWDLAVGDSVEAGRECSLTLNDPQASRRHAAFWFDGFHVQVTDLGSMNGTFWNGHPVEHCYALPGDLVHIGSTTIAIEGGS